MHPNPLFRHGDTKALAALVEQIGFAKIFLTTPDGPRVAHTPVLWAGEVQLRFHLARGNALARHLDGATALALADGPDAYVSPRWYADRAAVPTWDYVSVEMEGQVTRLDTAETDALLYQLIDRHEQRLGGEPWQADETPRAMWDGLLKAIVGFELTVREWRPTVKLSQKRTAAERDTIAAGQRDAGHAALADMMREFAA